MKKLMLGLLIAFAVTAAMAEVISNVPIGNLRYDLDTEAKTATITGNTASPTELNVSEVEHEGVSYAVIAIGDSAFMSCSSLTTVSLPNATSIGLEAFNRCFKLTSVSLPSAISIDGMAFSECPLTSISLPKVETIGGNAFLSCSELTSVSLPSATTIRPSAFQYCSKLTSLSLPNATKIGRSAFFFCCGLTSVSLPSATTIGMDAFHSCSELISVSLPSATTIEAYAFQGCFKLSSVLSPSATSIGMSAFAASLLTSVSLPNVTEIGERAFAGSLLTSISLPSVISIGTRAFSECPLTSASLPSATSIGRVAFNECNSLSSLIVNAEMKSEIEKDRSYYGISKSATIITEPLPKEIVEKAKYEVNEAVVEAEYKITPSSVTLKSGDTVLSTEHYEASCVAYGINPQPKPDAPYTPKEEDFKFVPDGSVVVSKESVQTPSAGTVTVEDNKVQLGVTVLKTSDLTAEKKEWGEVALTADDVKVVDGKIVISVPVDSASGFMILQTKDAKVVPTDNNAADIIIEDR